jgi:hypothetical protein
VWIVVAVVDDMAGVVDGMMDIIMSTEEVDQHLYYGMSKE